MLNLTDLAIQKLSAGYHWDSKVTGLGLRVGRNRKSWVVVKGKNRTKVTLGHYPSLSLADARKRAILELASPTSGRPALTFPEAKVAFLAQDKWRPRSKKVLESSLRHFDWKRPLDKITHEDVAKALDAIESPSARAHALKDIRSLFNWAVPRYLAASPAAGLKMPSQKTRDRVLTDDELRRVWIAAAEAGTFGVIVKLLILTGQRKSEIGGLQWDWISKHLNLASQISSTSASGSPLASPSPVSSSDLWKITIPANVTKNGREHSFPLSQLTSACLDSCAPRSSSPQLFVSSTGDGIYNGYAFHLKQLHKASQTSGWTLHDLRRTFATGLAGLGVPIHVLEKLLNHVSGVTGGLHGIYNRHAYWQEQQDALLRWEEKVLSLVRDD